AMGLRDRRDVAVSALLHDACVQACRRVSRRADGFLAIASDRRRRFSILRGSVEHLGLGWRFDRVHRNLAEFEERAAGENGSIAGLRQYRWRHWKQNGIRRGVSLPE